jgi:hypothetical protein
LWHGDIKDSVKKNLLSDPPDCLLTTPESLEVILLSSRADHVSFGRQQRVNLVQMRAEPQGAGVGFSDDGFDGNRDHPAAEQPDDQSRQAHVALGQRVINQRLEAERNSGVEGHLRQNATTN